MQAIVSSSKLQVNYIFAVTVVVKKRSEFGMVLMVVVEMMVVMMVVMLVQKFGMKAMVVVYI